MQTIRAADIAFPLKKFLSRGAFVDGLFPQLERLVRLRFASASQSIDTTEKLRGAIIGVMLKGTEAKGAKRFSLRSCACDPNLFLAFLLQQTFG